MKVLITGGAGFIGSHLAEHFCGTAEVTVLDNLSSGEPSNLEGLDNCNFTFGSVLNRLAVRRAIENADYVFHLAGCADIEDSFVRPLDCAEVETLGTMILLEEAVRASVRKVVFLSSGAVYGETFHSHLPRKESDHMEPNSPYAAAKLAGEVYCQMFMVDRDMPTVSVRCFNAFGPRQKHGVIPAFIHRAIKNHPLKVNGDSAHTRDFIYVKNVVAALVFLALSPTARGCFNLGSGQGTQIMCLAQKIIDITGSTSEIQRTPERPRDNLRLIADTSRLASAGFTPACDLERELRLTVADIRSKCTV